MESTEDSQLLEITALQSIYAEDFIECPPPKAWKGAARLHEFIIRVPHPLPDHADKISFNLHVKFPKTYPRLACPTFTIEEPIIGLRDTDVAKILREINAEAQKLKGFEMVFSIITLCQDWIEKNIIPPLEVVGSLALQMTQRAIDEERARKEVEMVEASLAEQRANLAAEELDMEIRAEDAMRQMIARERLQKFRRRANSEATEVPSRDDGDTLTETFDDDMEANGIKFDAVKLFHPRSAHLGVIYMAEPIVDDINSVPPLELCVVTFETPYYTGNQGRKKLSQLEQEVKHLVGVRHPKLLSVFAVKITQSSVLGSGQGFPKLMILSEQPPALTLHDVLEDCESLREDRASDYIGQILTALNALHLSNLVHRGITARSIGLTSKDNPSQPKVIKLCKASFHTRLLDLHRSNPFGLSTSLELVSNSSPTKEAHLNSLSSNPTIPEGWHSRDAQNESSLLYTRQRDIHDVGVVLLQMLMGLDVTERFPDAASAIYASPISPLLARQAMLMLDPPKKSTITCGTLLSDLNGVMVLPQANTTPVAITTRRLSWFDSAKTVIPLPMAPYGSPETQTQAPDYFRMSRSLSGQAVQKTSSRWKEDWEELELLGRGAFGSVVKARNRIDGRIYAVKKIRLKTSQSQSLSDTKIFREVNALSRLSNRNIVRYYTTWVETYEPTSSSTAGAGDDSGTDSYTGEFSEEDGTSVPASPLGARETELLDATSDKRDGKRNSANINPINGAFHINIEDFDDLSVSRHSFPSIHFGGSDSGSGSGSGGSTIASGEEGEDGEGRGGLEEEEEEEESSSDAEVDGDEFASLFSSSRSSSLRARSLKGKGKSASKTVLGIETIHARGGKEEGRGGGDMKVVIHNNGSGTKPAVSRTLYIQMEFVERQTLRERVDEGIAEDEAWRLFLQVVDALVHMSTLNILHRDIKLTNIFIDAKGDCKVGDFGLATSSLAAVDPSDVAMRVVAPEADMTLEVGTRLYIAPEVQSRKRVRGPRDHSKADMYSLGIVFFEMNFKFNTGAERIAVLEDLRRPTIIFPPSWDPHRTRQRDIITWLLQHDPDKRPSAFELSQSPLLPARLEDEYFKGALRLMAKPDSAHHQTVLTTLFRQSPRPSRAFVYDKDADSPEYAPLNDTVQDRLRAIFHLHGAVDMEPPLLMPVMDTEEEKNQATFIDRQGDIVALPNNILVPFARLAARGSIKRIKRYHIMNVFRPGPAAGHPKFTKAALFDVITPDLMFGPVASGAELVSVANDCLDAFPNLSQNYDIHISHSKIVEIAMNRVPADARGAVIEIIHQSKSTVTSSQKKALLVKKGLSRTTVEELEILSEVEEDVDDTMARLEKLSPSVADLMQQAVKEVKDTILYAHSAGVSRQIFFHPLMLGSHHTHFKDGVIIEVVRKNKNTDVLAAGGRYDNLIARFQPLKQKPEPIRALGIQIAVEKITAALASYQSSSIKTLVKEERSFGFWSPRRCDVYVVSYHRGYLQERLEVASYLWANNISADLMYESGLPDSENESHLDVCAREGILFTVYPRPRSGRNLPAFMVKSILKGTEVDLSRQELVGWLQHQIAEQKRVDATTSGAPILAETSPNLPVIKDTAVVPDVQLVLPDPKKQRKQVKQLFLEKAFEKALAVKTSFQNGMPVLAVDVSPAHFEAMFRNSAWISDEEAWKSIAAMFPPQHASYALTVREAAQKRKLEGHTYILLFAVREDRAQLLPIT